ncbi:MAG: hypothetical protein AABX33_06380 [Nanoarchaeota archaeon]
MKKSFRRKKKEKGPRKRLEFGIKRRGPMNSKALEAKRKINPEEKRIMPVQEKGAIGQVSIQGQKEKLRLQEENRVKKTEEANGEKEEKAAVLEKINPGKLEEKKPAEKKFFGRFFRKTEMGEKVAVEERKKLEEDSAKAHEKQGEHSSEIEELEDAIRSLDLFRKIEKENIGKEKPGGEFVPIEEKKPGILSRLFKREKPVEKTPIKEAKIEEKILKSKKLEKCQKVLDHVKELIVKENISKARKFYIEARNLYLDLEHEEKKGVYDELMEIYNRLMNHQSPTNSNTNKSHT